MSLQRKTQLYTGAKMPLFGLGTWQSERNQVYDAVKFALTLGYRHLDCAFIYHNENEIGRAISESGLWNTFHEPKYVMPALERSLKDLQLDYLDLYLMHWPYAQPYTGDTKDEVKIVSPVKAKESQEVVEAANVSLIDTWRAMEKLVTSGKVKHIGVSNFSITKLKEILKECYIRPAVNQVELHPYLPQHELLKFCNENKIHVTAYAPLGSFGEPRLMDDSVLKAIAEKNKTDVAHVLLAWGQQRGYTVIPKSTSENHIKSNFEEVELSKEDIENINQIKTRKRFFNVFPVFDD
ncbi:hypothetical protein L0F63_003338 [Massospora cicadina]|nr:hypothetical protein L0F63_003338 [Massospora cicadina]